MAGLMGDVFKALADPTRRIILDELQERSGQTLFELCVRLTTKHQLGSSRLRCELGDGPSAIDGKTAPLWLKGLPARSVDSGLNVRPSAQSADCSGATLDVSEFLPAS